MSGNQAFEKEFEIKLIYVDRKLITMRSIRHARVPKHGGFTELKILFCKRIKLKNKKRFYHMLQASVRTQCQVSTPFDLGPRYRKAYGTLNEQL